MKALVDGVEFLDEVLEARSMRERMRGLLGRDGLPSRCGMLIDPCGSIHTFYMKFELDVVFLDKQDRVVRVCCGVGAGRMVLGGMSAVKVLEMASGWNSLKMVREGSQIQFAE